MANRYWVTGGTGNWNSTTNWSTASGGASGASVPSTTDAALLDASSGVGSVTLDISPTVQTLTCTGFTGTLAFGTNTISLNSTGTIYTGVTTMSVTGTPLIICTNATATARTISPTAVTEANSISFRVTGGTGTFTLSAGGYRNLDFTDGTNPTGYAGALSAAAISVYGDFKASTGMTRAASASAITFAATSGTKTIKTASVIFDNPFTFNGVGGTWQLVDDLTSGATRTLTLTNGALDLNNKTFSTGLFNTSNANIRTLAFGTGNITLTGSSTSILGMGNANNLTITGTPVINATYSGSVGTRGFSSNVLTIGGTEGKAISLNVTAGTDTLSFALANNSYKNMNFTGFTGTVTFTNTTTCFGNVTFNSGTTAISGGAFVFGGTTGTQQITTNANTFDAPIAFSGTGIYQFNDALTQGSTRSFNIVSGTVKLKSGVTSTVGSFVASSSSVKYLQSTTPGSQATISQASGTITVSDLTIQDSNAAGGASWTAYADYENVDAGNNDGWNFSLSPPYATYEPPIIIRSFTQPRRF